MVKSHQMNEHFLHTNTELTEPHQDLGKKSLRSYESIASKIYSLAKKLNETPAKGISEQDLQNELKTLDLIDASLDELIQEEEAGEQKENLSGNNVDWETPLARLKIAKRWVKNLRPHISKRLSEHGEIKTQVIASEKQQERFNPREFFKELVRRPEFTPNPLGELAPFTSRYDVEDVQLTEEYPPEEKTTNKLNRVVSDINSLSKMLSALNKYESVTVMGEDFAEEKRDQIRRAVRPVWEKLLTRLEERKKKLLFEQWKETAPKEPGFQFFQKLLEIKTQAAYSDRKSAQAQLDVFNNAVAGLEKIILVEQKKYQGYEREVESFIREKYIIPIEDQAQPLEDEVYRLWIEEMNGDLAVLVDFSTRSCHSLEEYLYLYKDLGDESNAIQSSMEDLIKILPDRFKINGQQHIQARLNKANQRIAELPQAQMAFFKDVLFGSGVIIRQKLDTAVKDASNSLSSNDIDGLLQPAEQELLVRITNLNTAFESQNLNLIPENRTQTDQVKQEILDGSSNPNSPIKVLEKLRLRIKKLEDDVGADKQKVLKEIITEILSLKEDNAGTYNREYLKSRQDDLDKARLVARAAGVSLANQDDISDLDKAERHIVRLRELREAPNNLTLEEVVDELITRQADPFGEYNQSDLRLRDLIVRFDDLTDNSLDSDFRNPAELNRIVQKMRASLLFMDVSLKKGRKSATVDRSQIFDTVSPDGTVLKAGGLTSYKLSRPEFFIGVTYHPEWGETVRNFLEKIIYTSYEVSASGNAAHIISYEKLCSETRGRDNLKDWLKDQPGVKEIIISPQASVEQRKLEEEENKRRSLARFFIVETFFSHDMLTDILRMLQRRTKTRGHNPQVPDKDRIWLDDPAAGAVHSAQRATNIKSERMNWFVFQEITDDYCANDEKREILRKVQYLERLRRRALFGDDAEVLFDSIDPVTGADTVFTSTYDYVHLQEDEVLDWNTGKIKVTDAGQYPNAEDGWTHILNKMTEETPDNLSEHTIVQKAKKDSGLITDWIKAAGQLKMFGAGKTLEKTMEPLLTDYILRLFLDFNNQDPDVRGRLFREVIELLDQNGKDATTAAFQFELDLVIRNLMNGDIRPHLHYLDNGKQVDGTMYLRRYRSRTFQQALRAEEKKKGAKLSDAEQEAFERKFEVEFTTRSKEVAKNLRHDIEHFLHAHIHGKKPGQNVMAKALFDPFKWNTENIEIFVKAWMANEQMISPSTFLARGDDATYFRNVMKQNIELPKVLNRASAEKLEH